MNNYTPDPLGYYAILGVTPTSEFKEIKLNYRDRAKEWHPDYNKAENAMEHFQKLSVAYDVLQNEDSRLEYDLFAEAYRSDNYPQIDSLAIIKDRMGEENPFVRVFDLKYVVGKVIKQSINEEKLVCTQKQALPDVLKCSLSNWALGWWSPKAFINNIKAIVGNIRGINRNRQDNLTLLIHNAVVYNKEGKFDKAYFSAVQALEYANKVQKQKLEKYLSKIKYSSKAKIPSWRYKKLKFVQLVIPFLLALLISYPFIQNAALSQYAKKENEITYFQKVTFNSGAETVDDVVVSKIFDIPVDIYDDSKLFHLREDAEVMYGPGKKFDVLTKLEKGHTVRITGFTVDKTWYRIMLDNGEMGFVQDKQLKNGLGNKIKFNSKISVNNTEGE